MTAAPQSVPTLTEVIEIAVDDARSAAALPLGPDALPLDDAVLPSETATAAPSPVSTDAVLEQLQLRLDAWLKQRLAAELEPALREAIDHAASVVAHELRSELPGLVHDALQAVQHPGHPAGVTLR
jgi:hypothetical protein